MHAGGSTYFTNAWVASCMLRWLGCKLPIQWWYADNSRYINRMDDCAREVGATLQNLAKVRKQYDHERLAPFAQKPYSVLHAPFDEVMLLDADVVMTRNPDELFNDPGYLATGALFWPDYHEVPSTDPIWSACGILPVPGVNFNGGQLIIDKRRCSFPLKVAVDMNFDSAYWYRGNGRGFTFGEQDLYRMAWLMVGYEYSLIPVPAGKLTHTILEFDRLGQRIIQHRCGDKWKLSKENAKIRDFWFEDRCRSYLDRLRKILADG